MERDSVTGKQTTKDADTATNEEETGGKEQQRAVNDGFSDGTNLRENGGANFGELGDQSTHSRSSLQKHSFLNYKLDPAVIHGCGCGIRTDVSRGRVWCATITPTRQFYINDV